MDDLYHERVVAVERVRLFSLLWSYGEILAFRTVNQPSIDVREVDPNFVLATLILFVETQRAVGDGKGSMHPDLPFCVRTQWFQEPAYVSPFTWYTSWSPQWWYW